MGLAQRIMSRLTPEQLELEADHVVRDLARFAGVLKVHAAMEDEGLYPMLTSHAKLELRVRAQQLHAEVAGIYARFDGYQAAWASPARIHEDPSGFIAATFDIMKLLGARMVREEELYPLADRVMEA